LTSLSEQARLPMLLPYSVDLLRKVGDDEVLLEQLAASIQIDPVLSAKLLRVANSPFFGMSGRIHALQESLMVIGLSNTRAYVQAEILRSMVEHPPWDKVDLQLFWQHALWLASAGYVLANRTAVSPSMAFSVGLFHNFGRLVLLEHYASAYAPMFQQPTCGLALARYEEEHFHVDHSKLGAEILQHWRLPEALVQAVLLQYQAEDPNNANWLVSTLQAAHALHAEWVKPEQEEQQQQQQQQQQQEQSDAAADLAAVHALPSLVSQPLSPLQMEWFRLKPQNMDGLRNDIEIKFNSMMTMVEHGNTPIGR
jgi:HD-like signal output (HDOD) protein